ncbi:hypothetical protein K501DRAFT_331817 [Backusella circina FSU 941]|nr:hypothetical protein K501DRAFT_331817 [Backusella circina FSU 941]
MSKSYKLDVPVELSEKSTTILENIKRIVHLVTVLTSFLTICIVAPLISTEIKYNGGSDPGPNYTLFVAIISLPIPFLLVYLPWMYEHHNKFKRLGKFCLKNRTNFIFTGFNSFLWATAAIASTVHGNAASSCTFNADLQEEYGDDYTSAWTTQCNLGKVVSGFAWVTCLLWLITLLCTAIFFWKEKSAIQQSLKEHRRNKMTKLQQDEENDHYQGSYRNSGGYYQNEEDAHHEVPLSASSPFNDPVTEYNTQQNTYNSHHSSPHNMTYSPQQKFEINTPGQYAGNTPPIGFSPMPTPQHIPPHPEPTYYNKEQYNY